ncbi:MAG: hypothetical protein ACTSQ0_01280 [Candidatus Heimdallarchaeota archaeon]
MAKELIYNFKSNSEVEVLIDKLEERVEVRKANLDEELGYSLRNEDRSLEIQILPKYEGEECEVIIKAHNDRLENLSRQIFGKPKREAVKDASILDVAEFIAELPTNTSNTEINEFLVERFSLDEDKLNSFIQLIIKQASRENAREYIIEAAKKLA